MREDSAALRRCPTAPTRPGDRSNNASAPQAPSFDPLSRARSAHGPITHHFPRRSVALPPVGSVSASHRGESLPLSDAPSPRAPFSKTPKSRRPRRIFSPRPRAFSDLLSLRFDAFRVTPGGEPHRTRRVQGRHRGGSCSPGAGGGGRSARTRAAAWNFLGGRRR